MAKNNAPPTVEGGTNLVAYKLSEGGENVNEKSTNLERARFSDLGLHSVPAPFQRTDLPILASDDCANSTPRPRMEKYRKS